MSSKKIFDMGKNLKDEPFSIDGWATQPNGEISIQTNPIQFTGNLPKKRGRPKMTEQFWYDPDEDGDLFIGIDVADIQRGDVVRIGSTDTIGYVTNIVNGNTIQINWKITYKE